MNQLDQIIRTIHELTLHEKQAIRAALEAELNSSPAQAESALPGSRLIGLFAENPEDLDEVMDAVNERRSRPLRGD